MRHYCDDVYYFTAYPDDYVKNVLQHDDSGTLIVKKTRATFEVVFAYNAAEGTLELHTKGGLTTKQELEEIFIRTVVGASSAKDSGSPYDLSVIKDERFSLSADSADGLTIYLRQIGLLWPTKCQMMITQKDNRSSLRSIWPF